VARRFPVKFTESAKLDVNEIRDYIAADRPGAAAKWVRELRRQIKNLETMPLMYEVVPEVENLDEEYRHIIYGNYRVIYQIKGREVLIVRVFHAARVLTERHLKMEPERGNHANP